MNFTIERAAFLTAAKHAAQLAPSASPLEVLKCALLEIDTGTRCLHMTATNMEVTLRQDVPLLAYEGGDTTFAIDAKLLSAMLANLPGNTVECCKGDKDTLALSSDHAYYQAPTASDKGFPRMNITAPESMVKLSGVPSMVRRAAFATDPNNSNIAAESRRSFALIHFAGSSSCQVDIFRPGEYSLEDKLAAAETFLGGGTNFERPIREAIRLMDAEGFEKADVVFITDGECELPDACRQELQSAQVAYHFTVTGILLDKGQADMDFSLKPFCQKIYRTSELTGDDIIQSVVLERI